MLIPCFSASKFDQSVASTQKRLALPWGHTRPRKHIQACASSLACSHVHHASTRLLFLLSSSPRFFDRFSRYQKKSLLHRWKRHLQLSMLTIRSFLFTFIILTSPILPLAAIARRQTPSNNDTAIVASAGAVYSTSDDPATYISFEVIAGTRDDPCKISLSLYLKN